MTTSAEQKRPFCDPTGPVNVPLMLAAAARLRVPVARWVRGRHLVYVDGVHVPGWSPWPR